MSRRDGAIKVVVYGVGAIGGCLAAALARTEGVELAVIARGEHLEAIRSHGLELVGPQGATTVSVRATDDPAELGVQDYVLVALKAHQAWHAADRMAPLLGPDTALVTCQNGIPWWYFHKIGSPLEGTRLDAVDRNDRQWKLIGPHRAIGCVIYCAAEIVKPGVIRHIQGGRFAVGEPDGTASRRVGRLSGILEQAGFQAPVLDDIRSEVWLKLWGNVCFNPLSALTRAPLDVVVTNPGIRAIARAMMIEAEAIGTRLGARFKVDVERRIEGAARVGAHRTSMLQDLEAGRALEIDALVTAVQEMGRIVGVATPMTDAVLALVQQLGRSLGLYPTYPVAAKSPEASCKAD
jgi:2-dehydropantoate 2-reductase